MNDAYVQAVSVDKAKLEALIKDELGPDRQCAYDTDLLERTASYIKERVGDVIADVVFEETDAVTEDLVVWTDEDGEEE